MLSEAISSHMGLIPNDYYYREDIAVRELDEIFKKAWICVGLTDNLKNHHDFITLDICSLGIVVQNFQGKLRAFRNVCSHRLSRIQTAPQGNRPLICPYHGWSYNQEGHLSGIPSNRTCFGFSEEDKKQLALVSYELEVCGRFVFVRISTEGPSLSEYLGSYYNALIHLTEICPNRFESISMEWDANWKVGMDNAAEGYHVPLVHADSFAQVLTLDLEIERDGLHSAYIGKLTPRSLKWWGSVEKNIKLHRSTLYPEYANFLLFPNIVITFSYGAFLTFQTIVPKTTNTLTIYSNSWLGEAKHGPARDMVINSLIDFSALVRSEDQNICAIAQRGIVDPNVSRPLLLGELEGRIAHFQKAYFNYMDRT